MGTTFSVYLPASKQDAPRQNAAEVMIPRGSGRIQVMDDEEIIREVADGILSRLGYEVECPAMVRRRLQRMRSEGKGPTL
jgi:hypothetical protein